MRRFLDKVMNIILFILTGKGPIADEAVNEGLVDYSGQGRNKYGKGGDN